MAVKGVPTLGWTSRGLAATILLVNQEQRQAMAQRVASLMDARGLTNESLAYKSGLSVKTVSRILNARHESRIGTIEKLAGALGVSELDIRGEPVGPLGLGTEDGQPSQLDRLEAEIMRQGAILDALLEARTIEAEEAAARAASKARQPAPGRSRAAGQRGRA